MDLSYFNRLQLDDKGEYTFKSIEVTFLTHRDYYGHKVSLYSCENFFIEVYYFPPENRITRIEGIPAEHKNVDLYIINYNKNIRKA